MTLTLTEAKDHLTGAWKLLSFDLIFDDGSSQKTIQPAGPTPLGRALFTSDGFMSGTLTNPELATRISPATPWAVAPDEDIALVARQVISYMGPFRVLAEGGDLMIATRVHVSIDPSLVGTEQVRVLELTNNDAKKILTLKPVNSFSTPDGKEGRAVLVWEKMARIPLLHSPRNVSQRECDLDKLLSTSRKHCFYPGLATDSLSLAPNRLPTRLSSNNQALPKVPMASQEHENAARINENPDLSLWHGIARQRKLCSAAEATFNVVRGTCTEFERPFFTDAVCAGIEMRQLELAQYPLFLIAMIDTRPPRHRINIHDHEQYPRSVYVDGIRTALPEGWVPPFVIPTISRVRF